MVEQNNQNNQLKHLILVLRDYFRALLRGWYWYVLMVLVLGGFTFWSHQKKETQYVGQATFMTNADSPSGMNNLLQLAGQFGLGNRQQVSSEKLTELLASRQIITKALMDSAEIAEKGDLLINHYLEIFETDVNFKDHPEVEGFRFITKDPKEFNYKENLLMGDVFAHIKKGALGAHSSTNGIVKATFVSKSEEVSKEFIEKLVLNLSDYYISKTIEKQKETLEIITRRKDSVQRVLSSADASLLGWYDRNQKRLQVGSLSPNAYMTKIDLERKAEIASQLFIEAVKNKELAELDLEVQTPLIQIIDLPVYPLPKQEASLLVSLFLAFFFAGGLVSLILILRKLIKDALA